MSHKKEGGLPSNFGKMQHSRNMVNTCGFVNLGFNGPKFTWCNERESQSRIWERLDRTLANAMRIKLYDEYEVQHLTMIRSGHRPIFLDMSKCQV